MGSNLHPVFQQALAPFLRRQTGLSVDIHMGQPLRVYYEADEGSPGSDVEPPQAPYFDVLHVIAGGVDIRPLLEKLDVLGQIEDAALQQLEANK